MKLSNKYFILIQMKQTCMESNIVKLCGNTTNNEYADFTDQIIAITKNGQTIILEPEDLKKLEQVVGGKFRR